MIFIKWISSHRHADDRMYKLQNRLFDVCTIDDLVLLVSTLHSLQHLQFSGHNSPSKR